MTSYTECHPANSCVTCPLMKLGFEDKLKASGLIEAVMEKMQPDQTTSLEELVGTVKDEADIQESEMLAGVAIGAIAYRMTGRCPQLIDNEEERGIIIRDEIRG